MQTFNILKVLLELLRRIQNEKIKWVVGNSWHFHLMYVISKQVETVARLLMSLALSLRRQE